MVEAAGVELLQVQ